MLSIGIAGPANGRASKFSEAAAGGLRGAVAQMDKELWVGPGPGGQPL